MTLIILSFAQDFQVKPKLTRSRDWSIARYAPEEEKVSIGPKKEEMRLSFLSMIWTCLRNKFMVLNLPSNFLDSGWTMEDGSISKQNNLNIYAALILSLPCCLPSEVVTSSPWGTSDISTWYTSNPSILNLSSRSLATSLSGTSLTCLRLCQKQSLTSKITSSGQQFNYILRFKPPKNCYLHLQNLIIFITCEICLKYSRVLLKLQTNHSKIKTISSSYGLTNVQEYLKIGWSV